MKRFLRNFLLCACMMVLLSVCAFAAQVSVSDMKVKVNGVEQTPQAYLIDGNNYFKLRDLAMMLRETPNRFEVGYDGATKKVALTSGQDYTSVGGELTSGQDLSYTCKISPSTLVSMGKCGHAEAITSAATIISSSGIFRPRSSFRSPTTERHAQCSYGASGFPPHRRSRQRNRTMT